MTRRQLVQRAVPGVRHPRVRVKREAGYGAYVSRGSGPPEDAHGREDHVGGRVAERVAHYREHLRLVLGLRQRRHHRQRGPSNIWRCAASGLHEWLERILTEHLEGNFGVIRELWIAERVHQYRDIRRVAHQAEGW